MRRAWPTLSICENKGEKAGFYSDREKMQGKLDEFSDRLVMEEKRKSIG